MMEQIIDSSNKEEDFEILSANEDKLMQHMLLESSVQQKQNDQNIIEIDSSNTNSTINVNTNSDTKPNVNGNIDTNVNTNADNTNANTTADNAITNNKTEKLLNDEHDQLDNDYLIALALQRNEAVQQKKNGTKNAS